MGCFNGFLNTLGTRLPCKSNEVRRSVPMKSKPEVTFSMSLRASTESASTTSTPQKCVQPAWPSQASDKVSALEVTHILPVISRRSRHSNSMNSPLAEEQKWMSVPAAGGQDEDTSVTACGSECESATAGRTECSSGDVIHPRFFSMNDPEEIFARSLGPRVASPAPYCDNDVQRRKQRESSIIQLYNANWGGKQAAMERVIGKFPRVTFCGQDLSECTQVCLDLDCSTPTSTSPDALPAPALYYAMSPKANGACGDTSDSGSPASSPLSGTHKALDDNRKKAFNRRRSAPMRLSSCSQNVGQEEAHDERDGDAREGTEGSHCGKAVRVGNWRCCRDCEKVVRKVKKTEREAQRRKEQQIAACLEDIRTQEPEADKRVIGRFNVLLNYWKMQDDFQRSRTMTCITDDAK